MNICQITCCQFLSALLIGVAAANALADDVIDAPTSESAAKDTRCYELRVYHAGEGKLDALNTRFRDHTCKLFEKHGITNIGYWMPLDKSEQKLYYIVAYPSRAAREASWKAFFADPEWKAVFAESEKNGKLVRQVDSTFMHATDFSPAIMPGKASEPRLFELRTYTTTPGNLPNLFARFRDHTMAIFAKHGMTNFAYWALDADQKGAGDTLVYMLAHPSKEARDASFEAFRKDPDWVAAKAASEKNGSLTVPDGVKSVLLKPADYSPTK
ncbi:MAG TPA: NIPSNAP family protein [Pirellulales bacterium]|jgi:uncharacterized protein YbaA (DUF1428 family)|nr:NIPSNAP family protein [Pirellulales bacterium]